MSAFALCVASRDGNEETVLSLIEKGFNVNFQHRHGWTPLIYAVSNGHINVVRILLDNETIDVDREDCIGYTALIQSISKRSFEMVKLLVEHKADVNKCDYSGISPLSYAVESYFCSVEHCFLECSEEIVLFLIENGADVNARHNDDETPLMVAVSGGKENENIVRILIENGADLEAVDNDGKTPMDYAVEADDTIAKYLKEEIEMSYMLKNP